MTTLSASSSDEARATPRHPELAAFLDQTIVRGEFELSSGGKSNYYCDGKMVSFSGRGLELICKAIHEEIKDLEVDAIGGMDMGATPIVATFSHYAHTLGLELPSFVVRKEAKSHGTMKAIEGPIPEQPSRVVMVDDTVTSGRSIKIAIERVREAGHTVVLVISVLDRESGGSEAMKALSVPYRPLVTRSEINQICAPDRRLG